MNRSRILRATLAAACIAVMSGCTQEDPQSVPTSTVASPAGAFSEGGKWNVSKTGQPFMTPSNPDGDIVSTTLRDDNELDECDGPTVRTSRVVPQLVHGRYLLFSEEDGPARLSDSGALVDYSPTAFGAALGAYNAFAAYAGFDDYLLRVGDEIVDFGVPMPEKFPEEAAEERTAPELPVAFRVHDCSPQTAVVDLLFDPRVEGQYAIGENYPMVFENGTWILRTTFEQFGESARRVDKSSIEWEDWTQWKLG